MRLDDSKDEVKLGLNRDWAPCDERAKIKATSR